MCERMGELADKVTAVLGGAQDALVADVPAAENAADPVKAV